MMNEDAAVELDPLYYLSNFRTLLTCVEEQYRDLFNADEQAFIDAYQALTSAEQALLVRMYSRRHTIFRSDKLNYPELPPLKQLLPVLEQNEFVSINPPVHTADLLSLATVPEICQWWPGHCPKKSNRATLLAQLDTLTIDEFYDAIPFQVVEVRHQPLIELFKLLFFGNLNQDLTEFVTVELGHVRYENYSLDAANRLFSHRWDIDHAMLLMALRDELYSQEEFDPELALSILGRLPPLVPGSPLQSRFSRLRNRIGKGFEQLQMLPEALQAYADSQRPPARERTARIHFKQDEFHQAAAICETILQQPMNEAEQLFAGMFLKRCQKQLGLKPTPTSRFQPEILNLELPASEHRVELVVIAHLHQPEAPCFYVENWLSNAVFGLTFWDAIFAPVQGAFTHPFQRTPHDLNDIDFVRKRQALIQQGFDRLKHPDWPDYLIHLWQQKFGASNGFVGWYQGGEEILRLAATRIPARHWQAIFQRMLSDLRENCSGFPDLIQFYDGGGYRLLEVKSPTDKVQANQLRWMKLFTEVGIPCQLVQVQWLDENH